MCGRFAAPRNAEDMLVALDLEWHEFNPEQEVFPTNQTLVLFSNENRYQAANMTWGWQRNFTKRPLINARGREAWHKPTWSDAMHSRRCLIPASSFYEWDQNQPQGKRDRYRISLSHGKDFAMAGLYECDPDSGARFCSVLTTAPNKTMQPIHHRMPVILANKNLSEWLLSDDKAVIDELMEPISDAMTDVVKA